MISVCMATFNGENYIYEQLSSILCQLGGNDEIIISDDRSIDDTVEIAKSFNDARIKIYINECNQGYSKNFENALNKAAGDIIFIADQDDIWIDSKVKKMTEALQYADMVVSDAQGVNESLQPLYDSHFELNRTKQGFLVNFLKTRYIGACMAFRKEVLQKALPLPANSRLCAYDYWLAVIAEYYFKVQLVHEPLLKYRRHGKNASSGGAFSNNSFAQKVLVRIYTLKELLLR
jgi:glycosyltransferase involved in cell wall biosynthesis